MKESAAPASLFLTPPLRDGTPLLGLRLIEDEEANMPDKHPNTDRWGGPGASHENRDKPKPDPLVKDADAPDHLSPRSQVSGGGGEGDIHKGHNAKAKTNKQASSEEKAHELDGRRST